jgi:hypothetical protein
LSTMQAIAKPGNLRGKPFWTKVVRQQEQWIANHGGRLPGYVAYYHGIIGRSVENATANCEADLALLGRYQRYLDACGQEGQP